jgi:hypothetical protein
MSQRGFLSASLAGGDTEVLALDGEFDLNAVQTNVLRRVRRGNFEVNAAAVLRHDALEYAIHHPLRELKLIPLKLRSLVRGDSELIRVWINSRGQKPFGSRTASVLRTLADVAWYALLVATLAAVLLFRRELWHIPIIRGILPFMALAIPLYGFVYYGNFRYRLPLEPLMLLVVGAATALERARRGGSVCAQDRADDAAVIGKAGAPLPRAGAPLASRATSASIDEEKRWRAAVSSRDIAYSDGPAASRASCFDLRPRIARTTLPSRNS